jgi:phosphoribosylanthranilate isomerase
LYENSPRYISAYDASLIIKKLPPFVEKVALFVNKNPDEIDREFKISGATLAQIHFDVDDNFYDQLDVPYLKVVRAQTKDDILKFSDEYRLVDAYCESYGGSGKRLNIEWFEDVDCSKIILAGGLEPSNVASVITYGFYGVDVSSGVEMSHGKKDLAKVKEFILNAKTSTI